MTSLVACTDGAFARGVLPSEPSATLKVKGNKGSQAPVHPMTATQQVQVQILWSQLCSPWSTSV